MVAYDCCAACAFFDTLAKSQRNMGTQINAELQRTIDVAWTTCALFDSEM